MKSTLLLALLVLAATDAWSGSYGTPSPNNEPIAPSQVSVVNPNAVSNTPAATFSPNLSSFTVTVALSGTFTNTTWACISATTTLNLQVNGSSSVAAAFTGTVSNGTINDTVVLGVLVNGNLIDGETNTAGLQSATQQVAGKDSAFTIDEHIEPSYLAPGSNNFCLAGFVNAGTATIESTNVVSKFKVWMLP